MGLKVLLTGGAGYIGSHCYVALSDAGYSLDILDTFENAKPTVVDQLARITGTAPRVFETDVRDTSALRTIVQRGAYDAIMHFAGLKSVADSVVNPVGYLDSIVNGTCSLLAAVLDAGPIPLVFSSSASIYGDTDGQLATEATPPSPQSPYAAAKLAAENAILAVAASQTPIPYGILRYFNPVGAHQSGLIGEDPREAPTNLVPIIASVACGQRKQVEVYGTDYPTEDGTGVRDYIHIDDLARGHVLSLETLLSKGTSHILNLGTGRGASVRELVSAYETACGRPIRSVDVARRPGDPALSVADPSCAARHIGFRAEKSVADMCKSNWAYVSSKGALSDDSSE